MNVPNFIPLNSYRELRCRRCKSGSKPANRTCSGAVRSACSRIEPYRAASSRSAFAPPEQRRAARISNPGTSWRSRIQASRVQYARPLKRRSVTSIVGARLWIGVAPLGTDEHKPYLETAPWLIAVFLRRFTRRPDGRKVKHYYTDESVGIATGLVIAAVHTAGLVSLTHTPSTMGFMNEILDRPKDLERPYLLLVIGYPALDAVVPDISRLPLESISSFR